MVTTAQGNNSVNNIDSTYVASRFEDSGFVDEITPIPGMLDSCRHGFPKTETNFYVDDVNGLNAPANKSEARSIRKIHMFNQAPSSVGLLWLCVL